MQVKTNIRAGSGGASGAGKNSSGTTESPADASGKTTYVPPVSRCTGA